MSGKSGEAGGEMGRTPDLSLCLFVFLSVCLSLPPPHLFSISLCDLSLCRPPPVHPLSLTLYLVRLSLTLPTAHSLLSAGVFWAGPAGGTRSCCGSAVARSRCSGGCPAPGCRCLPTRGATRRSWPRWCAAASCRSRPASCGWSVAVAEAATAAARPEGPF